MGLADIATAAPMRRGVPQGFQRGASLDLDKGTASIVVTPFEIPEDEAAWREHIFDQTGMPVPDDREVILTGVRTWTMAGTENKHLTFRIVARSAADGTADIASLVKLARQNARVKPPKSSHLATTQTRIVGLSDEQLGKVDRNGGTEAFFERLGVLLADLDAEMKARPCEDAVILLGGDMMEGFESHAGQAFTNDLSHPQQLTTAHGYLVETITRIASRYEKTRVLAVPSNHAAWRAGKGYLGKPGDDYGLAVVKMVATALKMSGRYPGLDFIVPDDWEVSCAIPVRNDVLALTHGHVGTTSAASFDKWIDGQIAGDGPLAAATLIVNGHWHHHLNTPAGNIGDRERRRIQLPALDGGSSHFTNARGEWSHPGIWTAVIRDGYGLDHERVLRTSR